MSEKSRSREKNAANSNAVRTLLSRVFSDKRRLLLVSLVLLITGYGATRRLEGISTRGLEYDEIWTARHYMNAGTLETLTNLSTPNNHPLNSIAIKWSLRAFGETAFALRLPSLFFGVLLIPLVGIIAWALFKNEVAVLCAVTLCALNGDLVHFSSVARGYSLQTFLISLTALAMIWAENRHNLGKRGHAPLGLVLITTVLAVLTLSTSVIFLFPLFCCHLAVRLRAGFKNGVPFRVTTFIARNQASLFYYGGAALFVVMWYSLNYQQIKSGQVHGGDITGALALFKYFGDIFLQLTNAPILVCCLLALCFCRRYDVLLALLASLFFTVLCGYAFKCGPPRVYTFLTVGFIIVAAGGLAAVTSRLPAYAKSLAIAALLAVSTFSANADLAKWRPADWRELGWKVLSGLDKRYYPIFPPETGYELIGNFGRPIMLECVSRTPMEKSYMVSVKTGAALYGISVSSGAQMTLTNDKIRDTRKMTIADVPCWVFQLKKPQRQILPTDIVVIAAVSANSALMGDLRESLKMSKTNWAILNIWLTGSVKDLRDNLFYSFIYAADHCEFSAEALSALEQRNRGEIRVFILDGVDKNQELPGLPSRKTSSKIPSLPGSPVSSFTTTGFESSNWATRRSKTAGPRRSAQFGITGT